LEGLSRELTWLRIDAWQPERIKTELSELLGFQVVVYQRYGHQPHAASWARPVKARRRIIVEGSSCAERDVVGGGVCRPSAVPERYPGGLIERPVVPRVGVSRTA
jgi:hypothetical protein